MRIYDVGYELHCINCDESMYKLLAQKKTGDALMAEDFQGIGIQPNPKRGDEVKCAHCNHVHTMEEIGEVTRRWKN